jgi:hypothetical protein
MRSRTISKILALVRLVSGAAFIASGPVSAGLIEHQVKLTRFGNPVWRPAGFNLISAPIGTPADGFAEFVETAEKILPPPDHLFASGFGIVPGAPHPPPYDDEMDDGVKAAGFKDKIVFSSGQFSIPDAVWLLFMIIPGAGAPLGSSPDYGHGPIVPNNLFPITVSTILTSNGVTLDSLAYSVPPTTGLPTPIMVDGFSHFPNFVADAFDIAPAANYGYTVTITDKNGNGWTASVGFKINRGQRGHNR